MTRAPSRLVARVDRQAAGKSSRAEFSVTLKIVKRPSALETLKTLRQRQHEGEQRKLEGAGQLEHKAAEGERRAREAVIDHLRQLRELRSAEDERLGRQGISAAEGQRRSAWEVSARQRQSELAAELARAVERHGQARRHHDQMRVAVQESGAALKHVEQRLEQEARATHRKREHAQQEILDDASARRFAERSEP